MMRLVLILTLTVALGGCLQSGRFGRSQPAQPAVEAADTAPLGAVETAPLDAPGAPMEAAPPVVAAPAITSTNDPYTWARVDGQRMADNPLLLKQGQADRQACYAASATAASADAYVKCMRSRGYTQLTN
jgi:hypothetical protein